MWVSGEHCGICASAAGRRSICGNTLLLILFLVLFLPHSQSAAVWERGGKNYGATLTRNMRMTPPGPGATVSRVRMAGAGAALTVWKGVQPVPSPDSMR